MMTILKKILAIPGRVIFAIRFILLMREFRHAFKRGEFDDKEDRDE